MLVTINKNYIYPLLVMLYSLLKNNPYSITVYILHKDLEKEEITYIKNSLKNKLEVIDIKMDDRKLKGAPVSKKFPITMYYRLFAWKYLPKDVDKILYLDPDIIVNKDIMELYEIDLKEDYFAASTHVGFFIKVFNDIRLNIKYQDIYVNSGVLLMNLKELRKSFITEKEIYTYIHKNKRKLFLPDQDVLSKLYKGKIRKIEAKKFNFTEKMVKKRSISCVKNQISIIHYCGRKKPWLKDCTNKLKDIYLEYEEDFKRNIE